jgi:hypothetical protein
MPIQIFLLNLIEFGTQKDHYFVHWAVGRRTLAGLDELQRALEEEKKKPEL